MAMPIDFSFIDSLLWGSGERGLVFIFHSASELSEGLFFILHSSFFTLLFGWLLDLLLGDPVWLPHPVVGFGKAISFFEHRLNHGSHRKLKGALVAISLIAATYAVGLIINVQCSMFNVLLVFFCLAGTTLIREVRQVFLALDRSLEEGRKQVARIVGRDTTELSAQEVRTAALETLAENLSDGVIAPLFWYAILGVPGMLAYKMVNTLDSMIGYKTERYKDFGCWAARIDDIANYIPARLTALLMVLTPLLLPRGGGNNHKASPRGGWEGVAFVRKYGRNHASPNSGYPEAALAGILDCRFGGPHYYFGELFDKPYIGTNDRPLTTADMKIAVCVNRTAEVLMLLLVIAVQIIKSTL
jgi:adenosylcobinamide-phosphate synthase